MPSKSKVCFFFQKRGFALNDRTRLKKFLEGLFRKEKVLLDSLNYIFCTDDQLLRINRQFLNHDYYTDVISFGLHSKGNPVEGEIYISIDRVKENAKKLGNYFKTELTRVMIHGALHLCGYSDKTKPQIKQIRKKEDQYLANFD